MKTLIISAFPGCGKTFVVKNNKYSEYLFCDKDNGFLNCKQEFEVYTEEILQIIGKVDFLFISQYPEVLKLLHDHKVPYIVVAPNNSYLLSSHMRKLIKEQWFGRFFLRKNCEIWMNTLYQNYDKWTCLDHLLAMKPCEIILLGNCEYLSDIISDLEKMRELYGVDIVNN